MTATKTITQLADELEVAIASGDEGEQIRVAAALYRRLIRRYPCSLYHGNFRYRATILCGRWVVQQTPYPRVREYIPAQEIMT